MGVLMTMRGKADAGAVEEHAAANPDAMRSILAKAIPHGLVSHRFYANDAGEVLVLDEWETPEGFQAFFAEAEPEIGRMMQAAGMTAEPEVTFWRKLDTNDDYPS
jgi:heme-degrading monooxygenase HmoA